MNFKNLKKFQRIRAVKKALKKKTFFSKPHIANLIKSKIPVGFASDDNAMMIPENLREQIAQDVLTKLISSKIITAP